MAVDQKVRVILVVDGEPDVEPMFCQRMRREIRAGQYEFLFASSGLDALAVLSDRTDIDLVITDLNMPDMDGHDANRDCRSRYDSDEFRAERFCAYVHRKHRAVGPAHRAE